MGSTSKAVRRCTVEVIDSGAVLYDEASDTVYVLNNEICFSLQAQNQRHCMCICNRFPLQFSPLSTTFRYPKNRALERGLSHTTKEKELQQEV